MAADSGESTRDAIVGFLVIGFVGALLGGYLGYWWGDFGWSIAGAVAGMVGIIAAFLAAGGLLSHFEDPVAGEGERGEDGKEQGVWVWRYRGGQKKREANLIGGVQQGHEILWHKNGTREAEGAVRDGKKEGPWTFWDADGHKAWEGEYRNDLHEGQWTYWHPNGQKKEECHYQQGVREGPTTAWSEGGVKTHESSYQKDKLHGPWRSWGPSGKPLVETSYRHGVVHGPWTDWNEDGTLRARTHFIHGVPLDSAFRGDPAVPASRTSLLGYLFWAAVVVVAAVAVYREMFLLASILIFLLVLTIHEAGHFLAAKLVGIPIQYFRIGIGPLLFAFQRSITRYELHLFPVMGWVGEYLLCPGELAHLQEARAAWRRGQPMPPDPEWTGAEPRGSSQFVSRPRRLVFLLGGVTCNMLAAVVLLWGFLLLDARDRGVPFSAGSAALQAPQVAAQFAWNITRFLPTDILEGLKPSNLNKPGALAVISANMEQQTRPNDAAPGSGVVKSLLIHLAVFNIILFCFNLVPFPPLDGYWCLRLIVEMTLRRDLPESYLVYFQVLGWLLLALLILLGVIGMVRDLIMKAFS